MLEVDRDDGELRGSASELREERPAVGLRASGGNERLHDLTLGQVVGLP
jgi:hypothetical protein